MTFKNCMVADSTILMLIMLALLIIGLKALEHFEGVRTDHVLSAVKRNFHEGDAEAIAEIKEVVDKIYAEVKNEHSDSGQFVEVSENRSVDSDTD